MLNVDIVKKFKCLIVYLSLNITAQALCQKENFTQQTCPVQKLSAPQEEKLPTVLVFASFSMPQATIKHLAMDLKKVGGALVIRGLINNSFKKTAMALQKLGEGVLLDPTLFEKYNVTSVPTFIIFEGDLKDEHPPYDRLTGNVSLRFALERVTQEGEIKSAALLLEKLKGSKT
ncbi:MAG: type-F conjugative transfer system pilin assembly protein TrbC [Caedibacter sp. 38-128]|nr:MAG: type-F conjugative transfer system pilin assembly protein TrbC [Caedibacter sp. 38-128]